MNLKRVAVVFNPKGGSARLQKLRKLKDALESHGIKVASFATTPEPLSAKNLAQEAAHNGAELVIAMGGDGTIREVAQGLTSPLVPMSPYRSGTGNVFAENFYPDLEPEQYVEMLLLGHPQPIDLLNWSCLDTRTNSPVSGVAIVALGFGSLLDAIGDADPRMKKRFGKAAYAHQMALAATALEPVETTLSWWDTRQRTDALSAALIMNVPQPKVPNISPGCSASDGLLDFVGINSAGFTQLLSAGIKIGLGRAHKSEYFWRCRAPGLLVKTQRPVVINIDGDPGPTTDRLAVQVAPGAVRMLLSP